MPLDLLDAASRWVPSSLKTWRRKILGAASRIVEDGPR
jgi:hypothetical protein